MGAIDRVSVDKDEDKRRFVRLCLFDSLIGNQDRHPQNLAFLTTESGTRLSPFYDNSSWVFVDPDLYAKQNMLFEGRVRCEGSKNPVISDYVQEFIDTGHKSTVIDFVMKIKNTDFKSIIERSGLTGNAAIALLRLIEKNKESL